MSERISGSFQDYPPERLDTAPVVYRLEGLPHLAENLKVRFFNEGKALPYYQVMVSRLAGYLDKNYPGWKMALRLCAYEQLAHGQRSKREWGFADLEALDLGMESLVEVAVKKHGGIWTGGIEGRILIEKASPGSSTADLTAPWGEFCPKMFWPMADLEIIAADEPPVDLHRAAWALASNGFQGLIFRSGAVGRGRHHFLGSFLVPSADYWSMMAKLMKILSPRERLLPNLSDSLEGWCANLEKARDQSQANEVAQQILNSIPPDTETGSYLDFRWVAHSVEDDLTDGGKREGPILRCWPSKSYRTEPVFVGCID